MRELSNNCQIANPRSSTKANMILPHVMNHVERLQKWICAIYDIADRPLACDIATALEKVFALHSGTHLAYLFLTLRIVAKMSP